MIKALEVRDNSVVNCVLCGCIFHKSCETQWNEKFHVDGSWLCSICYEIEISWSEEDFNHDEVDFDDEIERKYSNGFGKCLGKKKVGTLYTILGFDCLILIL